MIHPIRLLLRWLPYGLILKWIAFIICQLWIFNVQILLAFGFLNFSLFFPFPLFKLLDIILFPDLVKYYIGIFMYKYHNELLPSVFNSFFTKVDQVHSYNTRHASKLSYYLPKVRTNHGKFNIRFQGPMIWNSIDEDFKRSFLSLFKLKLKEHLTDNY